MIVRLKAVHWATARSDEQHFLAITQGDKLVVVEDRCKHRGGPLSKGIWNSETQCIICPWHELVNSPRDLARRQVPSVRIGDSLEVVALPPQSGPSKR